MKPGKSMQEISEWGELKTFFDRRLIKAIGHPVREHILAVLNERIASAREIGADVSSFYHHIEELERLECIELVETKQRRGANEHFFRAKRTVFFDDEAWRQVPVSLRTDLATRFIQAIIDDATIALQSGTLTRRGDEHVSWTPADFDEVGWKEATELMNQTLERLSAIQRESSDRLAESREECVSATVGILALRRRLRPGKAASAGERPRSSKYRIEHRLCESAGEGVLLAGVVAAK